MSQAMNEIVSQDSVARLAEQLNSQSSAMSRAMNEIVSQDSVARLAEQLNSSFSDLDTLRLTVVDLILDDDVLAASDESDPVWADLWEARRLIATFILIGAVVGSSSTEAGRLWFNQWWGILTALYFLLGVALGEMRSDSS